MSSILPEYEYDIFISYRQNDNKYDSWVTEFVDDLQKELDATLKNPVSIYFDENPHDGLQETHVVDESLKKKLKCLIFIPILSQTYCDESSFAWQHEFLAFNEMAKADELGMNITLSNGNVASRILPVQIHQLEPGDQTLMESLIGPLRSIKFIYKNTGVNRPLRIKDDDLGDNRDKTNYRNQINKVANALKDLGTSILSQNEKKEIVEIAPDKVASTTSAVKMPPSTSKKGLYIGISVVLLTLIGLWTYTTFFLTSDNSVPVTIGLDKTIAVLPFSNTKPDPDTDFLGFALANQIIGDLNYNKNVIVRPASSVRKYDKQLFDRDIVAKDLKVNYVLIGTYLMQDDIIRLNIELLEANSENVPWREKIEVDYHNAFDLQDIVAKKVVDGLQAQFSQTELNSIGQNVSSNPLAYEYYLRSLSYPLTWKGSELAIQMLTKSIELDPDFAPVYTALGDRYHEFTTYGKFDTTMYRKVEKLHQKSISLNKELLPALLSLSMYYTETANIEEAVVLVRKVLALNSNNAEAHFTLSYIYRYAGMNEEAVLAGEKAIALDPGNSSFRSLSLSYYNLGKYEKALETLDLFEPSEWITGMRGTLYFAQGKKVEASKIFDQIIEKDPDTFWGLISATYKAILLGDTLKGLAILQKRELLNIADGEPLYYSATDYAMLGNKDGCNRLLRKAINAGYFNYPVMLIDPFLVSMQDDPEFQEILSLAKAKHEAFKEKYF
jgi:TolB-like protein